MSHAGSRQAVIPAILAPFVFAGIGGSIKRGLMQPLPDGGAGAQVEPELLERYAAQGRELRALQAAHSQLQTVLAERAGAARRLDHLAHHDALTGLPNRTLLMDRLTQALTFARRAGSSVLVIYLDLDCFKTINDSLGHPAGDRVLAEIGSRIAGCMRGADTASRVGGDEFILVCATNAGASDAPQIAARVLAEIAAPIEVLGTRVELGASLGISVAPGDGSEAEDLIEKADAAMYSAKQRGRNCFNLYTSEIQAGIERKLALEAELRQAVEGDQFEVHYQPIVDPQSGRVSGAEALVRWQHPTRGLLAPHDFIAFAQEHGFGAEIGASVLQSVCRQLNRFAFALSDDFSISMNVSANEFQQPGFVKAITAAIAASGAEPRRLVIEVAGETFVGDARAFGSTLRDLRKLGVQLAIDDFGIGTCSLAALKHLPLQQLKIDRSFVRHIATNATDEAIAKTIVTLGHGLALRVVATGVETHDQLHKLRALGADRFQGFLISQPLAAAEFETFACVYGGLKLAA